LTGERLPLYGSIVIMFCIIAGVLLYFLAEWIYVIRAAKKERKIVVTDLTELEQKPIEQQDISVDDA